MTSSVTRAAFPAMSVSVEITAVGAAPAEVARAVARGRRLAEEWETRFSRFRPDSVLSRLNAAGGQAVPVDGVFLDMLETAKAAVQRTGGRFDPSVLPALEAIGYDRSIELVQATPGLTNDNPRPAAGQAGWSLVGIDRVRGEVSLPPGMRIDLGGVAKGAFVDRFAAELAHWPGGCVDAGGDLRVWGTPPDGDRWRIGIEDPFALERDLLVAQIPAGGNAGVATSGAHRRRWVCAGRQVHHLIDPRTGLPVADDVRAVTAFAADVTSAEIAAKALMIAATPLSRGETFGAMTAVVTYADGRVVVVTEETPDVCAPALPDADRSAA